MNKNNSIFTIVILVFAAFTFANCQNNKDSENNYNVTTTDSTGKVTNRLPIAYINVDSLLLHYQFAKNANEELMKAQESSRATLNSRMRKLQEDANEFQRKLNNNAFLSRDRAEEEGARLQKQDQELQDLSAKLQEQFLTKQQKLSEQLRDTINVFLKEFNKDKRYEMIISNTANDNILWADPTYDITNEVIDALNKRMKK
jgi:outer membrane protein